MRKILERREMVLVLAILALLALVLLTNALSAMDFLPSQPVGGGTSNEVARPKLDLGALLITAAEQPLWKQVAFWAVSFMVVVILTSLLSPEMRKQVLYAFLRTAISALILLYFIKERREFFADILGRFSNIGQNLEITPQADISPAPVFEPPQEVGWVSFAVTLAVIVLGVLLIWWLRRLWIQFRGMSASSDALHEIAAIARDSLNELNAGHNYENAIIECYDRMSEVAARRQGLKREHTMTPSEFSTRLTRAGLPRGPIETLTALFEAVRYGSKPAGEADIHQAVHSLNSILAYCGETGS